MVLRVTQYGESVLRQKGQPLKALDEGLRKLANDMIETMHAAEGVGLAAQQVGHALPLFVVDISDLDPALLDYQLDGKQPPIDLLMPMVVINPQLRLLPGKPVTAEEGCLSFPGIRIDVPRADSIELNYQDLDGSHHVLHASGWFARVIQHEYDHVQGVLFIDHLETRALRLLDSKLKRLKRAAREFMN